MRFILLFILFMNHAFADAFQEGLGSYHDKDKDYICEEFYPVKKDNIQDIQKVLNHNTIKVQIPYYFYFEGKNLEDLQALKNCIDYTQCGRYEESIVDDPANYRMHLWKSMSMDELNNLVKTCPIPDLAKKLVVRYKDQKGKNISVKQLKPYPEAQKTVSKKASPAIFHEPSQPVSKAVVDLVKKLLLTGKTNEAHNMILYTWGIDLHGYSLSHTQQKGSFAVTNHDQKTIKYGNDWLSEPCDFIRMIRHEAEHVAQVKMSNSCPTHNFDDHNKRERAAHLNDARFMNNVCVNTKAGADVRKFCLERFRSNYMKTH
jgi:hypothetical protein